MNEFLAFVRNIGTTLNGENIYEFMFTIEPETVWGENFNIVPAGIIPNLLPEQNSLSSKARLITDLDLQLACKSTCFSMMDSIDGIIALCFTYVDSDIDIHFDFGETIENVIKKLKQYNLELIEYEEIKLEDDDIINDVIKQLEDNQNDDGEF
jgi:hypothetical protein